MRTPTIAALGGIVLGAVIFLVGIWLQYGTVVFAEVLQGVGIMTVLLSLTAWLIIAKED